MDFRFALRSLYKNPAFTLLAVLVMGLGIGASTAVFSVVRAVLLKPLDYPEPGRIVTVRNLWKKDGHVSQNVSGPDFHDWQRQSASFSALAYYSYATNGDAVVKTGAAAEYAGAAVVTPNLFAVFGIEPVLGHFFAGGDRSAMIGYGFWQSRYGGRTDVLGRTLRVQDQDLAICGVLPPGFSFPGQSEVWIPSTLFPETTSRTAHNYRAVARLKPGVSLAQAQTEMTAIAARLERQYPENRSKSVRVMPLRDTMVRNVSATLYLLLGAVGVLLLIASVNVANLLLARATARGREIAIRAAVGAGRGRIVRLLALESLLLALLSGAVGLLLAWWGSGALVAAAPRDIPRLSETSLDGPVLAFSLGCSLVCCLLFGLAPAFAAARVDCHEALKQGGRGTPVGGASGRLRGALVLAEIASAVVLLSAAGLLMRSFLALNRTGLGFRPEKLLVMQTSVPVTSEEAAPRAWRFYDRLLEQVAAMPGALAVGATVVPPPDTASNGGYSVDHPPLDKSSTGPQAVFSVITPGALRALEIPLKAGRDFDARDRGEAPPVAIINETLARQAFPGQNPIGRFIFCGLDSPRGMRIVGVAGDVRQNGPAAAPEPEILMPYRQHAWFAASMSVLVRTAGDPVIMADAVRRQAVEISPDVPVKFTTMRALLAENVAAPRFRTLLFAIFAAVAMVLAMAGVYGVMAYAVGQRIGEIGLRLALGAKPADVLFMVLRQGLTLAGAGVALGLAGALAAARLLSSVLFEVKPADPLTYAGVAAVIAIAALAACYVPARRAMKLDPLEALRQE